VTAEAAGLYLMRTRFYDPRAGRFLREDDLGLAAGPNLYAYANGDPMNLIDPSGQEVPFMYQLEPYGGNTGGDMEFSRVIWPDYISVGGNLAGFGFSIGVGVIVDRNWNVYLTGAGSEDPAAMVKATKPSASAQLVIGYYRPDGVEPTSPDKLKDFVGGSAIAYGVGFGPYIGASSAQSGTGMEFGAGAGLNLSSSRSWLLIEPANPTEQVHWSVFNDMWKQATTCPIERARDLGYDVYIDHTTGSMFISDHARENERGHIKLAYRLQSGEIYWMDQGSGVNGR
jgi:RHS repeat-associated protein